MTRTDIAQEVAKQLYAIAPDINLDDIDQMADLREEFDIDSLDFLRLITALGQKFDLPMPEEDYSQMASFNALIGYLLGKTT